MITRSLQTSPQVYARAAGVLYLVVFAFGWTLLAWPHVSASGDALATARSIARSEPRLHAIAALALIPFICDIPLAVLFFALLAQVSPVISGTAALLRITEAVVGATAGLGRLAVLALFTDAGYAKSLGPDQVEALAALSLAFYNNGIDIAFIFFGLHCIALGYLIFRSRYLPKFLGVLLPIAGACYLVNSVADIATPTLAAHIPDTILLPGFIAELSLCLWLLIKASISNVGKPESEPLDILTQGHRSRGPSRRKMGHVSITEAELGLVEESACVFFTRCLS